MVSCGFISGRESDQSFLFRSLLRRANIFFESDVASSSLTRKWWALACLMVLLTLLLACVYSSMWTTRPVFRFFLSMHRLACFALMTASSTQAEFVQAGTTFSPSGACLFKRSRRVALYRSTRLSMLLEGSVTRGDWARSSRNCDLSMPFTRLHFTTFCGPHGLERSVPIMRKKWSDKYTFFTITRANAHTYIQNIKRWANTQLTFKCKIDKIMLVISLKYIPVTQSILYLTLMHVNHTTLTQRWTKKKKKLQFIILTHLWCRNKVVKPGTNW